MGFSATSRQAEEIDWSEVEDSAVNTAVTATHAAEAGNRHYAVGFEAVVSGADLGNDVNIELLEGVTVRWRTKLGSGLPRGERSGVVFPRPIKMGVAQGAILTADAGGAGVIITLNLGGYTL